MNQTPEKVPKVYTFGKFKLVHPPVKDNTDISYMFKRTDNESTPPTRRRSGNQRGERSR